ncbi:MAG: STAS domain-containing protein [Armatimonadetes bacterium]|nr:STAS domain-containing protein [Armatimonadota bacterium]
MPDAMTCQIRRDADTLYLCLEGDLDEKNFLTVSYALAGQEINLPVKVDLARVQYADSTGLRALVLLQRQAREAGVAFYLMNPSEPVKRIFHTTGLSQIFQLVAHDTSSPCGPDALP